MCGLLQDGVCLPAGQILPANNRVTSWKPLTAADELVPGGAGGRGGGHILVTRSATKRVYAA